MQQRIDLYNMRAEAEVADLTVIILTYNEEKHIERCLAQRFSSCQPSVCGGFIFHGSDSGNCASR